MNLFQKFVGTSLKEFGASNETELLEKLTEDTEDLPCRQCKKSFPIDSIVFVDDDPFCPRCANKIARKR